MLRFAIPGVGYRLFYSNIAALAAACLVPLEYAPYVFWAFSLLIFVLPLLLLLPARQDFGLTPRWFALGALCFLLITPNYDSWLTTVTSGFLLSAAGTIILISPVRAGLSRILAPIILATAALTGLASLFLVPFYFYRWIKDREPDRIIQTAILALFGALQFVGLQHETVRHYLFSVGGIFSAILANQILLPLVGYNFLFNVTGIVDQLRNEVIANQLGVVHFAMVVIAVGAVACYFILLAKMARKTQTAQLLSVALVMSVFSIMGSLEGAQIISLGRDCRYFYVPNVLIALSFVFALRSGMLPPVARYVTMAALAWVLAVGAREYFRYPAYFYSGPAWADQVAAWRDNPALPLNTSPSGWKININTFVVTSESLPLVTSGSRYKGPLSLSGGTTFTQRFQASADGLYRIGIQTVTWARTPGARDYPIDWSLDEIASSAKTRLCSGLLQARAAGDWTAFDIPVRHTERSKGKWFELVFRSPRAISFDHSVGFPLYAFSAQDTRMAPAVIDQASNLGPVTAELRLTYRAPPKPELGADDRRSSSSRLAQGRSH